MSVANHALEYRVAAGWDRLTALVGWRPRNESEFLLHQAALNGVCAGATLGVLCWLATAVSRRLWTGLLAVAMAGSAYGFLRHATHSTQPMPAVLLVWVALALLLGSPAESRWRPVVSGAIMTFASAVYLPTILALPAMVWAWDGRSGTRGQHSWRGEGLRICAGFVLGAATLALLLVKLGASTAGPPLDRGADFWSWWRFWLTVNPWHWAQVPVGLASSLWAVLPESFRGLRSLGASADTFDLVLVGIATSCSLALLAALGASLLRGPGAEVPEAARSAMWVSGRLVLWNLAGPLLVSAYYDKLWILPITGMALWLALAVAFGHRRRRLWAALAACWVALTPASWRSVAREATSDTGFVESVRRIQSITGPDSLVLAGWDPTSVYYSSWSLCAEGREVIPVLTEIARHGPSGAEHVRRRAAAALRQGRAVFVLGLLDQSGHWADQGILARDRVPVSALRWMESVPHRPAWVDATGTGLFRLETWSEKER